MQKKGAEERMPATGLCKKLTVNLVGRKEESKLRKSSTHRGCWTTCCWMSCLVQFLSVFTFLMGKIWSWSCACRVMLWMGQGLRACVVGVDSGNISKIWRYFTPWLPPPNKGQTPTHASYLNLPFIAKISWHTMGHTFVSWNVKGLDGPK